MEISKPHVSFEMLGNLLNALVSCEMQLSQKPVTTSVRFSVDLAFCSQHAGLMFYKGSLVEMTQVLPSPRFALILLVFFYLDG